jgi:histidinol-phosphate aminotransferase
MAMTDPSHFIRPQVRRLHPYVPGEQPKIPGLIKLNTNENPYPPSPAVLKATRDAVDERLRLYPNPTAQALREKLASYHKCAPENILIGNGSDEVLALAVRGFVEPMAGQLNPRGICTVQYFTPSYSLYPVLAEINGSQKNGVPLMDDFSLPSPKQLSRGRIWDFRAALTLITTPNAPSGRGYANSHLEKICEMQKGVVVLDEAYVDFANESALSLAFKYPHVMVARTFSKAYSLCFQRIGYMVGDNKLIGGLDRIRDSYNVNGLGQIAALATLGDLSYYRKNFQEIRRTRQHLSKDLSRLGFEVFPSQANFILVKPPLMSAREWLEKLREQKILVRWFDSFILDNYLRITIGTPAEAVALAQAAGRILKDN